MLSASLDRAMQRRKTITDPADANGVVAEYLPRPLSLLIVGAGVDALPVVDFAIGLGFRVTVMDHRSLALAHPRLAATTRERVLVNDLATAASKTRARAALVMTHNLRGDEAALTGLLAKESVPREYIGVLGPRARTEKMLASIGTSLSARPEMSAPAGLDLGGDGADAVALAIVSEIFARLHGRDGRALSMKEGPIHEP
jgi:xanthine/CO dehydrogenase XdhC/CoxF family maturation factor